MPISNNEKTIIIKDAANTVAYRSKDLPSNIRKTAEVLYNAIENARIDGDKSEARRLTIKLMELVKPYAKAMDAKPNRAPTEEELKNSSDAVKEWSRKMNAEKVATQKKLGGVSLGWSAEKLATYNPKLKAILKENPFYKDSKIKDAKFTVNGEDYVNAKVLKRKTTKDGEVHKLIVAYNKKTKEPHYFATYGPYDDVDAEDQSEKAITEFFNGIKDSKMNDGENYIIKFTLLGRTRYLASNMKKDYGETVWKKDEAAYFSKNSAEDMVKYLKQESNYDNIQILKDACMKDAKVGQKVKYYPEGMARLPINIKEGEVTALRGDGKVTISSGSSVLIIPTKNIINDVKDACMKDAAAWIGVPRSGSSYIVFKNEDDKLKHAESNTSHQYYKVDKGAFDSLVKMAKSAMKPNPVQFAFNRLHQERKTIADAKVLAKYVKVISGKPIEGQVIQTSKGVTFVSSNPKEDKDLDTLEEAKTYAKQKGYRIADSRITVGDKTYIVKDISLNQDIEKEIKNLPKYRQELASLKKQESSIQSEINSLKHELQSYEKYDRLNGKAASSNKKQAQLKKEIERQESLLKEVSGKVVALQSTIKELEQLSKRR